MGTPGGWRRQRRGETIVRGVYAARPWRLQACLGRSASNSMLTPRVTGRARLPSPPAGQKCAHVQARIPGPRAPGPGAHDLAMKGLSCGPALSMSRVEWKSAHGRHVRWGSRCSRMPYGSACGAQSLRHPNLDGHPGYIGVANHHSCIPSCLIQHCVRRSRILIRNISRASQC